MKSLIFYSRLFFVITLILLLGAAGYFFLTKDSNKSKTSGTYSYIAVEPDAPITRSLTVNSLSSSATTNTKVQGNSQNKLGNIKSIENIKYSPDGTKGIVFSDATSEKALTLVGSDGNILKQIESVDVINADFTNNNQVYYQKIGKDFGIFTYTIKTDAKKKFIETTDPEFFNNIAMIDEDNYFFIQPKTGKYGYASIKTGKLNIVGQRAINTGSILDVDKALLSNPIISPDKKTLILTESSQPGATIDQTLKVFPSNETKFSTPKMTAKISTNINKSYRWGEDGKFLTIGDDSTTINIDTKTVAFKGQANQISKINFSPDKTKAVVCVGMLQRTNCRIESVSSGSISSTKVSTANVLPEGVGDVNWLNNDTIVFVIGKSLYDYKVSTKTLEKATGAKGDYKILNRNTKTGSLLIKQDDQLKELKLNK